jgi:hypothetical protein
MDAAENGWLSSPATRTPCVNALLEKIDATTLAKTAVLSESLQNFASLR